MGPLLPLGTEIVRRVADRRNLPETDDPEVARARERGKTIRSLGALGMILATAAGSMIWTFNQVNKITNNAIDQGVRAIEAMKPNQIGLLEVQTALNEVKLPDSIILVEGRAEASGKLSTVNHLLGLGLPGTSSETDVTADVRLQEILNRPPEARQNKTTAQQGSKQAIELKPYLDKSGAWKVKAIVDAENLTMNAFISTKIGPDGKPMINTDNGQLRKAGSLLSNNDDPFRVEAVKDYAGKSAAAACGPVLVAMTAEGVQEHLKNSFLASAGLLAETGNQQAADLLKRLAENGITVEFQRSKKPLTPGDLTVPAPPVPDANDIAKKLGMAPKDLTLTGGNQDCKVDTAVLKTVSGLAGR